MFCVVHDVEEFGQSHYAKHPSLAMNDECTCSANFMPKKFGEVHQKGVPGATAAAGAPLEKRQRELMMGRTAFQEEIATLQKKKEIEDVVDGRIEDLYSLQSKLQHMKSQKETQNDKIFARHVNKLKDEVEIISRAMTELKKKLETKKEEQHTLSTKQKKAFDVLVEGENELLEEMEQEITELLHKYRVEEESDRWGGAQPDEW
tara:strand:- start:411 stop:1022 length:612 start_codon:yes stop_codon:yes gene_type:complete